MLSPPDSKSSSAAKPDLKDLTGVELEQFIASLGKEKFRARQIMKWLYGSGVNDLQAMTTLARNLRCYLADQVRIGQLKIAGIQTAKDGTKKILYRLEDGYTVESVLIPGKNHWTICISTQVGCQMGCSFCLTGQGDFQRNLRPAEITDQITMARFNLPEGQLLRNCVLMGMGEPLANYENTLQALKIITSDAGLNFSQRRITVSTCGLIPGIIRLGGDICVNLAISLNAADNQTRSKLMPINQKYPLEELLDACRRYPLPGRRMLTFEYILIGGVNSSRAMALKLCRLLKGIRCKLNLIPFNEFPGSPYRKPAEKEVLSFQQALIDNHFTTIIRKSHGEDIMAACGQLSGSRARCDNAAS